MSAILLAAALAGCATEKGAQGRVYVGRGTGATPLGALSAAKIAAVYQAAVGLLGEPTAAANKNRIERAVRDSDNPNAYVFNETLKILHTGGSPISYEIQIAVNVDALDRTLQELGITSAEGSATGSRAVSGGEGGIAGTTAAQPGLSPEVTGPAGSPLSAAVRSRIERDLDHMTYMVTFADNSGLDPFIVRSATTSADAYLADHRIPYVDSAQVEVLRKDQERVYEQETGKSVSIVQWIAQRLHADVYIVIDGAVSTTTRGGRYLATADVSLRMFETSTGSGMGAANFSSLQPSVSLVSDRDALVNAVQSSVYQAMGEAVHQARAYLARDLTTGITYDLLLINTSDDRAMSAFMKNLALRVRDVRLVSWSPEETRYRVVVSGTASDLQDLVYQSAQAVPGFGGMTLVTLRGRELTFDTGM